MCIRSICHLVCLVLFLWGCQNEQERSIENLRAFAKAYGYAKYFHPSDEASKINWDKFAIYGAGEVEKCENTKELAKTLNRLFQPIAPSVRFYEGKPPSFDVVKITPNDPSAYEPVYWQHQGVSMGMDMNGFSPYASVRVNSTSDINRAKEPARFMISKDAKDFSGHKIKFTAWAKREAKHTQQIEAYLRMVIEKSDGTADLEKAVIASEDWKLYQIETVLDSASAILNIGAALKGKGGLYLDQVELSYEANGHWVKIPIENGNFENVLSNLEDSDGGWFLEGDAYTGKTAIQTYHEGRQSVFIHYISDQKKHEPIFDAKPDFGEIIQRRIGLDLTMQMPLVLYADKAGTYPKANEVALERLMGILDSMETEPVGQVVFWGNLINAYNVFAHFYPYFDVVDVDWEAELEKAFVRSFDDHSAKDHLVTLQKFTAPLRDGHMQVANSKVINYSTPEIAWEWIGDQLVVTRVLNKEIALTKGDVITHINGQATHEYFKEINSRIAAPTKGWLQHRSQAMALAGEKGTSLMVTVNGSAVQLTRNSYPYSEPVRGSSYERIDDEVYYLNLNSIEMDTIDALLPELAKAKSIICDLRVYPNGNHGFLSHLLKENDTTDVWMQIPQAIHPNQTDSKYRKGNWKLKARQPYLGDKQIIFLTSGRAISYAESYMGYIEGYDLATIVGQPTAGTNGNINAFNLPGGYRIVWTGMKVEKHDGSQLFGVGFSPDVPVEKTIEGVKQGRDEVLERAIEMTRLPYKQMPLPPD